ncbi:MAG: twin-arginine translocase TatA/TatE family subunit [Planctomycetota bacterium]|nr:twin-arginine translocase TatA/TatE family subunit [Planctomycetota bacterium]
MFGLDTFEILVIVILAVVLFGRKLPEVTRALGRGVGEFRRGLRGIQDEVNRTIDAEGSVGSVMTRKPEENAGVDRAASDGGGSGFDYYDKAPAAIGPPGRPTGEPVVDVGEGRTKPDPGDDQRDCLHGDYAI